MMKRISSILILLFVVATVFAAQSSLRPILQQLDSALEKRQYYLDRKEEHIRQIKAIWHKAQDQTRYDLASEIYNLYNGLNTDSALLYARYCEAAARMMNNKELLQRAMIYESQCYSINCMFELASSILEPMATELYDSNRLMYYKACNSICIWRSQFSTLPEEQEEDNRKIPIYRQHILDLEPNPIWRAQEEALLQVDTDGAEAALQSLLPILRDLPIGDNYIRFLANSVGSFYNRLGEQDSALYYYAVSAICDLQHGVMEHASLREVALILFRQGDIERAYRYMNCCIEDAEYCKARLRTIEMAGDMPVILDAYQRTISAQRERLRIFNVMLIGSVVLLILIVVYAFLSRRRLSLVKEEVTRASEQLRSANSQLKESLARLEESNQSLSDSNRIRSAYVTQYMKECSEAIEKLGIYHKRLLKTAMNSNYEKLLAAVKSTDFIDENLRDFYLHFDETFLSLFPNFVEDFNKLLRPDQQFERPVANKLSTELRIFALIRLGISDSDDIARFLRLSTKTVYNYRAAVRNRAAEDRDRLEEQVLQIGL